MNLWQKHLPQVKPFYAVKCNNLEPLLRTLRYKGVGFDCASSDEFGRVVGSEVIYANPCKSRPELLKAKEAGIEWCTFDTLQELEKIADVMPNAKPLLRLHVDDKGGARIPLNKKFGMAVKDLYNLIYLQPNFKIYGLAFHVGSDCMSTKSYESAFETVEQTLELFKGNPNFDAHTLDIGGGFSGKTVHNDFFANMVAPLVRKKSAELPFKRVIAEPGRFFAEESCSLRVPVIGRKILPDGSFALTVDESVYGMFSGVLFDGFKPDFTCLSIPDCDEVDTYTIFGRTCDSADRIAEKVWLPRCINEGDILEVKSIGAYSYVSASEFNGFPRPEIQEVQ